MGKSLAMVIRIEVLSVTGYYGVKAAMKARI
jgi:hypothetical protein